MKDVSTFDEKLIEMRNKEFKAIHTQTHIHFNIVRVVMIPYLLISSLSIFWEHFCILPLFKSILHISNNLSFRSKFNSYPSILLFHLKFDDVKQSWNLWHANKQTSVVGSGFSHQSETFKFVYIIPSNKSWHL